MVGKASVEGRTPYLLGPQLANETLTRRLTGVDATGAPIEIPVIEERPLTIYLNGTEVITAMSIGDFPRYLAIGFLRNQHMLRDDDEITGVDYDAELETIVVRTKRPTDYEEKMRRKTRTSGCAVGTVFGDVMEGFDRAALPQTRFSLRAVFDVVKSINLTPSLYLEVGAVHGTVLCERTAPLVFMEDVGRHNAVDKIAGWMFDHQVSAEGKWLYTTGRLTSEMVIKAVHMGLPLLVSRSGFTAWGAALAQQVGLTLIGRLRGQRFMCLSGSERLIFDHLDEADDALD